MTLYNLFSELKSEYSLLNPHHDTWVLWTKSDKSPEEIFEVVIGTILVQNTNWKNVDKAIDLLKKNKLFSFENISNSNEQILVESITPAGFFNQKKDYLKSVSELFIKNTWKDITRQQLLTTKGIGKETADSILNYCLKKPFPIIGTYTKRFLAKYFGKIEYLNKKYENIQNEINNEFIESENKTYDLGLFHALIVVHSQNICTKRYPKCNDCFLKKNCKYNLIKKIQIDLEKKINYSKSKIKTH